MPREFILDWKSQNESEESIFASVEMKWDGSFHTTRKKAHEPESRRIALNVLPYFCLSRKDKIITLLGIDVKEEFMSVKWSKEGHPIHAHHEDIDDVLNEVLPSWAIISEELKQTPEKRHRRTVVDNKTISSFATNDFGLDDGNDMMYETEEREE